MEGIVQEVNDMMKGTDKDAHTLQETLDEEAQANEKLAQIAESHANVEVRM